MDEFLVPSDSLSASVSPFFVFK